MNSNGQHELKTIEKILKKYLSTLAEAAETIRLQDVSKYPIFVISQNDMQIGIPLLEKERIAEGWIINASTLEEFYSKQIINEDKIHDFKTLYKSKKNNICVFAVLGEGGKFLFLPA
jgi:hypothetical protein